MTSLTALADLRAVREVAEERLHPAATTFVNCEGTGKALRANLDAWGRWAVRPRVLVDVREGDTSTTVIGQRIDLPVIIAPFAFPQYCDPSAEHGLAVAAARAGTLLTLAFGSTTPPEEVGAVGPFWMHLEEMADRGAMTDCLDRGVAAGATTVCLTVSRQIQPLWSAAMFQALVDVGFTTSGFLDAGTARPLSRRTFTWDDLDWLRDVSPVPIVLKGVQTAEDARLAREHGAAGIVVSNHGGFMCDDTLGTAEMLEEIAAATDGGPDVLVDGGIRTGADVFRALALGARAVLIGRAALWGLASGGADGCHRVLEILREELAVTMAMAGARDIAEIGRTSIQRRRELG